MKDSSFDLAGSFKTLFLALLLASGIGMVQAWTGPLEFAPGCTSGNPGCDAPVHVGPTTQTKSGTFGATNVTVTNQLYAPGNTWLSGRAKVGATSNMLPSVALDVESATRGFLPPRISDTSVITNPVDGLMVYNDTVGSYQVYNDGSWRTLSTGSGGSGGGGFAGSGVPVGAVMFFDSSLACSAIEPAGGWEEYTHLQGRYAVGAPSGGGVGSTAKVGSPLTNLENRATGHHYHSWQETISWGGNASQAGGEPIGLVPSGGYVWRNPVYTSYPIVSAPVTTADGTNAPYVQLRACRKK